MIEKGKIVATPEAGNVEAPRMLVPHSEQILKETIGVFNRLVQEIGTCFPSGGTNSDDGRSGEDGGPFLIDEAILDTTNPRRVFAKRFARRVKHPRFRYIAPGLMFRLFQTSSSNHLHLFYMMHLNTSVRYPFFSFAQSMTTRCASRRHLEMSHHLAGAMVGLIGIPQACTCHIQRSHPTTPSIMDVCLCCNFALA